MALRTRNWLTIFLAGFVLITLSSGLAAQEKKHEELLGIWDVQTEDGSYTFEFAFSLEEGKLVGKFTGSSGTVSMDNLTYEDYILKFSVDINGTMIIDFSAIIDGEKLSGMLSLEYGEANIIGSKRKKT